MSKMTHHIAICSGKGGTGKTSTAINLAAAFKQFNKDTTIIDASLTTPNLGVYMGFPKTSISIHDVLKGKNHATEAVYIHPSGLKLLLGSINVKELVNLYPEHLKQAIKDLKGTSELIIIDNAAGIGREVIAGMKNSDEILIVTNPDLVSVTDALRTMKIAESLGKPIRGIVVTKVKNDKNELSIKNIEELLEKDVISIVPYDDLIKSSITHKDALVNIHPNSKASLAYKELAAKILGMPYKEEKLVKEHKLSRMFRFFGIRK